MALSQQNLASLATNGALLEKVIINNDLSGLSSMEKVQYVKHLCQTLGLNPLTKPIQLMKFQGKETIYFAKDATEQLRKLHKISLRIVDTKIIDDLYIVTAEASTPSGRIDTSTGAIVISKLSGEAKANAIMKAETKAKRRVTLSICGLGFIDECEVESIPGAQKIEIEDPVVAIEQKSQEDIFLIDEMLLDISQVATMTELEDTFKIHYKTLVGKKDKTNLSKLIEAKDKKKTEINVKEFEAEYDAAEVKHEASI